jgi:hypothetical protein
MDCRARYECQGENLPNTADPMKREILDAVKLWYHYDWLAIENKNAVVPAVGRKRFCTLGIQRGSRAFNRAAHG